LKAGLKPATTNRDLASLRSALTKAKEWKLLATDPLATVKQSRVDVIGHVRFLSADEETRRTRDARRLHLRASSR
jgi:hypothetical protein